MTFDTHRCFSTIISPCKYTQRHSSEDCLFSLEKTCDVNVRSQQEASSSAKLLSENKIDFVNQILRNKEKVP